MPHPIVLHHFDRSPFSEKIRVVFGFKGLSWRSVRIPPIMPKPDLMPLTGGYRRTPVMQIGADVFCDTQIIIREIERRFPSPTLFPPGAAGAPWALSSWTDRAFFQKRRHSRVRDSRSEGPSSVCRRSEPVARGQVRSRQDAGGDTADARSAARPPRLDRGATGRRTEVASGRFQPCRRQRLHERLVRAVKPLGGGGSSRCWTEQHLCRPQAGRGMGESRASDRTWDPRRNVRGRSSRHRGEGQPGSCRRERSRRSERAQGRRQGARRARRLRKG